MTRWGKIAAVVIVAIFGALGLNWLLNFDLTRGLEEEKSLTHNAMLAYRRDPGAFDHRIFRDEMHNWSNMEFVLEHAHALSDPGPWTKTSDEIPGVPPSSALDLTGEPYCVVREDKGTFVFTIQQSRKNCAADVLSRYTITPVSSSPCVAEHLCSANAKDGKAPEIWRLIRD